MLLILYFNCIFLIVSKFVNTFMARYTYLPTDLHTLCAIYQAVKAIRMKFGQLIGCNMWNVFLRSETSFSTSFSAWFSKKSISLAIKRPNFIVSLSLLREISGNISIVIVCQPDCDVINFEINPILLIKPFFLHDQKVKTKIYISWERK